MAKEGSAEKTIRDIKRQTRRQHSAEEKIRIVLEGLRGEETISEMVRAPGARRPRYRGTSKNQLQAFFIAAAVNLKRLARSFAICFDRFRAICHTASQSLETAPIIFQQNLFQPQDTLSQIGESFARGVGRDINQNVHD